MATVRREVNPFMLMTDPQVVLARIEHSERLDRLQRRICRPLDRPQLQRSGNPDLDLHDRDIDEQDDTP